LLAALTHALSASVEALVLSRLCNWLQRWVALACAAVRCICDTSEPDGAVCVDVASRSRSAIIVY